MKRILLLGGSVQQIPAIRYANEKGYYTILCDYLIDNPGQKYADEYHCVSTTDKEAVLKIARESKIDGIVAYASDPAAATAAYVGNILGLPSNPYEAVEILSNKDLFRKFLQDNGFNCPFTKIIRSVEEILEIKSDIVFPLIMKPTDSSGSKGVYKVYSIDEIIDKFELSMSHSRKKSIIIEEFIETDRDYVIGGDGFVIDGKLVFCGLLNSHRDLNGSPFVPVGTSYPSFIKDKEKNLIQEEVQKVLDLLHINMGALNFDFMFDKKGKLFIIEIGPRNGGNMIPELLKDITGIDMIEATIECALGNCNFDLAYNTCEKYYSTFVLHSDREGFLKNICFNKDIDRNIYNKILYKNIGDRIEIFNGANKALGIIFLKFDSLEELKYKMRHMNQLIDIVVN